MVADEALERRAPGKDRTRDTLPVIVTAGVLLLVAAGAVRLGLQHRQFVTTHPMNLVWIGGSVVAGLLVFRLNGARVGFSQVAPWLGYGVLAAYLGFAVQAGVSGALLRHLGSAPGALGYLALGVGAAASQTLGKWLVLRFLGRLGVLARARRTVSVGLAVGLGFGLAEVVLLGENQIVRHVVITSFPWLGIWERAAAVGLHVFTGAVLAFGIYQHRWVPVVVVLALQSVDDLMADAVAGGILQPPVVVIQVAFTVLTVVSWAYYRTLRDAVLDRAEAQ